MTQPTTGEKAICPSMMPVSDAPMAKARLSVNHLEMVAVTGL